MSMIDCPSCGARLEAHSSSCSSCGKPLTPSIFATHDSPGKDINHVAAQRNFLVPGTVIANRYRVIEFVGHGGMGEVIRAQDLALDQVVALKFLPANLANDPRALERVRSEVRMARLVSHPNVCRVHDLGTIDSQYFISMEYIDGEDLDALLLRVGRLAGTRALEIARELCAGLAAAHAAGVIHRDLKPANVMLDRQGHVRITDFGLALTGEEGAKNTAIQGTPAYIAPEQLAGAGATVKSDLYSLGLVLYEVLTGRRVFSATTMPELLRLRHEAIIPPTNYVREIVPAVEATILHCLSTRPEHRPNSALEVLSALSGGDPMKAALAAGQTPSPSAVAAAPVRGVLKPSIAWLLVAIVITAAVFFTNTIWRTSVLGRIRSPLPPEALAVKAEEAMHVLGHGTTCSNKASGFIYNDDALNAAVKKSVDPVYRTAAEKRTILYWHRCSPVPIFRQGVASEVTIDDPPLGHGHALALMDLNGRLLEYRSFKGDEANEARLSAFINFAGLELPSSITPIEDGHSSLNAKLDGNIAATVDFELNQGKLTNAIVVQPWKTPAKPPETKILQTSDFPDLLITIMILASIPLAVHNLKAGRGDVQGTLRVGLVVFFFYLVGGIISANRTWIVMQETHILTKSASDALYRGVTACLLYLALEPFVRRVWPETLVSWTRLLSGNVRDPMVARDILIGTAATWSIFGLWAIGMMLSNQTELFVLKKDLHPLFGLMHCAALTMKVVASTVRMSLMFLLLLLLFRILSRIRWLAPIALLIILVGFLTSILNSDRASDLISVVLAVLWSGMVVLLLSRFGFLAMLALIFWGMLSAFLPDPAHPKEWTSLSIWWQVSLAILISILTLYFATGRMPFGKTNPFETRVPETS